MQCRFPILIGLIAASVPACASAARPAKRPQARAPKASAPGFRLSLFPAAVRLRARDEEQQLLVTAVDGAGKETDRTDRAIYRVSNPKVARVSPSGLVTPV